VTTTTYADCCCRCYASRRCASCDARISVSTGLIGSQSHRCCGSQALLASSAGGGGELYISFYSWSIAAMCQGLFGFSPHGVEYGSGRGPIPVSNAGSVSLHKSCLRYSDFQLPCNQALTDGPVSIQNSAENSEKPLDSVPGYGV